MNDYTPSAGIAMWETVEEMDPDEYRDTLRASAGVYLMLHLKAINGSITKHDALTYLLSMALPGLGITPKDDPEDELLSEVHRMAGDVIARATEWNR